MSNRIRIPKRIWNTYEPSPSISRDLDVDTTPTPAPRIRLRIGLPPPQSPNSPEPEEEARTRTQCKLKIARFNYGGPQRQQKGQWQNQITLEQPCLKSTCPNCLKYHARLMRDLTSEDDVEEEYGSGREQKGGVSTIDPRLLDETPLVEQAMYNTPVETTWHSTIRESYLVRLLFRSEMGRMAYRRMVGMWNPQERKRVYDRARRARLEESNGTRGAIHHRHARNGHVTGGYKVKLVFMTKQGRAAFAELVRIR